ncbi:MAG: hypothetical protein JO037_25525 [Actinobacteria bacterium]|nr:hypothetical protein [Actinomycetota bacterium]
MTVTNQDGKPVATYERLMMVAKEWPPPTATLRLRRNDVVVTTKSS